MPAPRALGWSRPESWPNNWSANASARINSIFSPPPRSAHIFKKAFRNTVQDRRHQVLRAARREPGGSFAQRTAALSGSPFPRPGARKMTLCPSCELARKAEAVTGNLEAVTAYVLQNIARRQDLVIRRLRKSMVSVVRKISHLNRVEALAEFSPIETAE